MQLYQTQMPVIQKQAIIQKQENFHFDLSWIVGEIFMPKGERCFTLDYGFMVL